MTLNSWTELLINLNDKLIVIVACSRAEGRVLLGSGLVAIITQFELIFLARKGVPCNGIRPDRGHVLPLKQQNLKATNLL